MGTYQGYGLEGASPVDLVVALYDGIIRFLTLACDAVDRGDIDGRRGAAKRALNIILHLQSRLRMDIGGAPAQALSEFYAATFAEILQASQSASRQKFLHAIDCVHNVRDAWRQVAGDLATNPGAADGSADMAIPMFTRPNGGFESSEAGGRHGLDWTA